MSELSVTEKYFEEYRKNKLKVQELTNGIKDAKAKVEELTAQRDHLNNEIHTMQLIITDMIDSGLDPVESKLKHDNNVYRNNMWDDRFNGMIASRIPPTSIITTINIPTTTTASSVTPVTSWLRGTSYNSNSIPPLRRKISNILKSVF